MKVQYPVNQESYKMSQKTAAAIIENQPNFNLESMKLCIRCPWQWGCRAAFVKRGWACPVPGTDDSSWLQLASRDPQQDKDKPLSEAGGGSVKRYKEIKYLLINQKSIINKA